MELRQLSYISGNLLTRVHSSAIAGEVLSAVSVQSFIINMLLHEQGITVCHRMCLFISQYHMMLLGARELRFARSATWHYCVVSQNVGMQMQI